MGDCPECPECDGTGLIEVEIKCDCKGCLDGEHWIETDCGRDAFVPCGKCGGTGYIKKKIYPCYNCYGTGIDHNFLWKWKKQSTLDGEEVEFIKCVDCQRIMYREEYEKIKEKRKELDQRCR